MTAKTYPPPTDEAMTILASLLADHGVELRVTAGGELQLRDPRGSLTADDRALVHHYRAPLADWLERGPDDGNTTGDDLSPDDELPHGAVAHVPGLLMREPCNRCGNATGGDVPIHQGRSTRRDCARCGRTMGFPVWYGATSPSNPTR